MSQFLASKIILAIFLFFCTSCMSLECFSFHWCQVDPRLSKSEILLSLFLKISWFTICSRYTVHSVFSYTVKLVHRLLRTCELLSSKLIVILAYYCAKSQNYAKKEQRIFKITQFIIHYFCIPTLQFHWWFSK